MPTAIEIIDARIATLRSDQEPALKRFRKAEAEADKAWIEVERIDILIKELETIRGEIPDGSPATKATAAQSAGVPSLPPTWGSLRKVDEAEDDDDQPLEPEAVSPPPEAKVVPNLAVLSERKRRVLDLITASGPLPSGRIARELDIPQGSITQVLRSIPNIEQKSDGAYGLK